MEVGDEHPKSFKAGLENTKQLSMQKVLRQVLKISNNYRWGVGIKKSKKLYVGVLKNAKSLYRGVLE